MTGNTHEIESRLEAVRQSIRASAEACGRAGETITLVAVSKTRGAEEIRAALAAGQHHFGENYVQEALAKINALADEALTWHFIGPVQSNKTRAIAAHFHWLHSLDRFKPAERLSRQRSADMPPLNVCIQVNISAEAQKGGVSPEEAPELCAAIRDLPGLRLRGLMAIPAPARAGTDSRAAYRRLRLMAEEINARGFTLDTLSMGMSADMDSAISEGATLVRVGTAIFGKRNYGK